MCTRTRARGTGTVCSRDRSTSVLPGSGSARSMVPRMLRLCLLVLVCAAAAALVSPAATSAPAAATKLELRPARTESPLRSVSPGYISFALDGSFVRDPSHLPADANNATYIDFQNPLLRQLMPLVGGGFLRIGGTYTDFIQYVVPGTNYTRCPYHNITKPGAECPGNSFPCCLPLSVDRWHEVLEFAHAVGIRVTLNLNVLHGRWESYTAAYVNNAYNMTHTPTRRPAWDSSNARALMEWTVANVPPDMWPSAFGLGNELDWYLAPEQWAGLRMTFGGAPSSP